MEIDKSEYAFNNTLKADDVEKDKKVKIEEVKPVSTRYGEKFIAVLDDGNQIFLNSLSLQNLCENISNETDQWIGKEVILSTEASERTRGKKTIVILTDKSQKVEEKTDK
jgi:hypothetical protein